jgi:hypothetical protein
MLPALAQGLIGEFGSTPAFKESSGVSNSDTDLLAWRLVNGLWGVLLALGLLASSLSITHARAWHWGVGE